MDEEKKRIYDQLLAGQAPAAEEDELTRINAMAAESGREPLTQEEYAKAKMVGQPVPEPTTGEKAAHVGARWGSGLLDTADIPYYIDQASDAVGGFIDEKAPAVGEAIDFVQEHHPYLKFQRGVESLLPDVLTGKEQATKTIPGLTQARELTEAHSLTPEQLEQAPITRAAGTGAEWIGLPGASAAATLLKGGSKKAAAELAKREITVAGVTAGGAAAGSEAAGAIEDSWRLGGELIGGATALIVAIKTGKTEGLTSAQRKMLTNLQARFENPDEAMTALQQAIDNNELGTLADLTGSQNIANAEALLARTEQGRPALDKTVDARVNQIYEETTEGLRADLPETADAATSQVTARQTAEREAQQVETTGQARLDQARAESDRLAGMERSTAAEARQGAEQRLDQARAAEEQAQQVEAQVKPAQRPDQYSAQAHEAVEREAKKHKAEVSQPAWDAYDSGAKVDTLPMRGNLEAYLQGLTPQQRKQVLAEYPLLESTIARWPRNANPTDITDTIQDFKAAVNEAKQAGKSSRHTGRLSEIIDIMEADLTELSPEYAEAVAKSKEGFDRYGRGYIADARANEPELFFGDRLTGDQGAVMARLIDESQVPELRALAADRILSDASRRSNLDEGFLTEYEAVLDNLDAGGHNTRDKVVELIEARRAAEGATAASDTAAQGAEQASKTAAAEQDRLTKALEAEEGSISKETETLAGARRSDVVAQYGKSDEAADQVVQDILTGREGGDILETLREKMLEQDAAQGGTYNIESLRKRVNSGIEDQLFKIAEESRGATREATGDAIRRFRDMRRRLVDQEIISAADADYVDSVLSRVQTDMLRKKASAQVASGIESAASESTNLMSSMMSAILLAPLPGGYNLQLGGAMRRYFKAGLEVEPTKRNIEALTSYLTNPEEFLRGIEKLDSPAAQAEFVLAKLVGTAQAAEILGGE